MFCLDYHAGRALTHSHTLLPTPSVGLTGWRTVGSIQDIFFIGANDRHPNGDWQRAAESEPVQLLILQGEF